MSETAGIDSWACLLETFESSGFAKQTRKHLEDASFLDANPFATRNYSLWLKEIIKSSVAMFIQFETKLVVTYFNSSQTYTDERL